MGVVLVDVIGESDFVLGCGVFGVGDIGGGDRTAVLDNLVTEGEILAGDYRAAVLRDCAIDGQVHPCRRGQRTAVLRKRAGDLRSGNRAVRLGEEFVGCTVVNRAGDDRSGIDGSRAIQRNRAALGRVVSGEGDRLVRTGLKGDVAAVAGRRAARRGIETVDHESRGGGEVDGSGRTVHLLDGIDGVHLGERDATLDVEGEFFSRDLGRGQIFFSDVIADKRELGGGFVFLEGDVLICMVRGIGIRKIRRLDLGITGNGEVVYLNGGLRGYVHGTSPSADLCDFVDGGVERDVLARRIKGKRCGRQDLRAVFLRCRALERESGGLNGAVGLHDIAFDGETAAARSNRAAAALGEGGARRAVVDHLGDETAVVGLLGSALERESARSDAVVAHEGYLLAPGVERDGSAVRGGGEVFYREVVLGDEVNLVRAAGAIAADTADFIVCGCESCRLVGSDSHEIGLHGLFGRAGLSNFALERKLRLGRVARVGRGLHNSAVLL